jgi:O-methyltransferase involved in polyketide biosynthesis
VDLAADLSNTNKLQYALAASGFDHMRTTIFTCEGLLYYLPPEAAMQLIVDLGRMASPGHGAQLHFINKTIIADESLHVWCTCTTRSGSLLSQATNTHLLV